MPSNVPSTPWPRLLSRVLTCPLCREPLHQHAADTATALRCASRHTFDVARQGYVSLLTGAMRTPSADTPAMVEARAGFLEAGHYRPPADLLAEIATGLCPPEGVVADAGTGTGHYLAHVLDAVPDAVGIGLDASKFALRRASRAHPRLGAVRWDVWQPLPVRTDSVDVLLNVFAPRNAPEFHRVLRPEGALVVVTPAPGHLVELRRRLGLLTVDADKAERLHGLLDDRFRKQSSQEVEYTLDLTARETADLVAMGPNAHHRRAGTNGSGDGDGGSGAYRTDTGSYGTVTASFRISVYRPR